MTFGVKDKDGLRPATTAEPSAAHPKIVIQRVTPVGTLLEVPKAMSKIEQLSEVVRDLTITIDAREGNHVEDLDQWQKDADAWTVTLWCGGRKLVTPYFTGTGNRKPRAGSATPRPVPPSAADVLSSLVSDASASGSSFEEWCSDFGYSSDSRAALRMFQAGRRTHDKLRAFLGDAFDRVCAAEH